MSTGGLIVGTWEPVSVVLLMSPEQIHHIVITNIFFMWRVSVNLNKAAWLDEGKISWFGPKVTKLNIRFMLLTT